MLTQNEKFTNCILRPIFVLLYNGKFKTTNKKKNYSIHTPVMKLNNQFLEWTYIHSSLPNVLSIFS